MGLLVALIIGFWIIAKLAVIGLVCFRLVGIGLIAGIVGSGLVAGLVGIGLVADLVGI